MTNMNLLEVGIDDTGVWHRCFSRLEILEDIGGNWLWSHIKIGSLLFYVKVPRPVCSSTKEAREDG